MPMQRIGRRRARRPWRRPGLGGGWGESSRSCTLRPPPTPRRTRPRRPAPRSGVASSARAWLPSKTPAGGVGPGGEQLEGVAMWPQHKWVRGDGGITGLAAGLVTPVPRPAARCLAATSRAWRSRGMQPSGPSPPGGDIAPLAPSVRHRPAATWAQGDTAATAGAAPARPARPAVGPVPSPAPDASIPLEPGCTNDPAGHAPAAPAASPAAGPAALPPVPPPPPPAAPAYTAGCAVLQTWVKADPLDGPRLAVQAGPCTAAPATHAPPHAAGPRKVLAQYFVRDLEGAAREAATVLGAGAPPPPAHPANPRTPFPF